MIRSYHIHKKMKVLFMTTTPAPYRVEFFNLLSKRCELTVIYDAMDASDRNSDWFRNDHIQYHYEVIKEGHWKSLTNLFKNDYDIIIVSCYATLNGAYAILYLKIKNKKFFINADGGIIQNDTFFTKFLKTFFISKADYWLSSGNKTSEYFLNYGAKDNRIYLYPFTSLKKEEIIEKPTEYIEKLKMREEFGLACDKLILSVGRFIPVKGIDILLKAFKKIQYPSCKLLLIGGGELRSQYEQFINENNLNNVVIIDFIPKEELIHYYKMSDFFVFPTKGDIWGLVTNEAMAAGLPMISSNMCISACDLIEKQFLYEAENDEQLAEKINNMLYLNQEQMMEIGNRNLNVIRDYTIEEMVDKHICIFNEVLENMKLN